MVRLSSFLQACLQRTGSKLNSAPERTKIDKPSFSSSWNSQRSIVRDTTSFSKDSNAHRLTYHNCVGLLQLWHYLHCLILHNFCLKHCYTLCLRSHSNGEYNSYSALSVQYGLNTARGTKTQSSSHSSVSVNSSWQYYFSVLTFTSETQ